MAMKIPFSGIIIIWCSVMSFACFMAMGIDKLKARAGKWRIPERTLFLLAAMAVFSVCWPSATRQSINPL